MRYERIAAADVDAALTRGDAFRLVLGTLQATFRAGSFGAAAEFVSAIAGAADDADHHPDIDIRYPDRVYVALTTHHEGGVTRHDIELANRIEAIASAMGVVAVDATDGVSQSAELCIDTVDADVIRPFWAAVFDYERAPDGSLYDPRRRGWPIWFQQMDEPRTERNRFHVDVSVAHDVAEQRIASALAAGGALVSDRRAKAFWILADADGNEACICTWQDRG